MAKSRTASGSEEPAEALLILMKAIAARKRHEVAALLKASSHLARDTLQTGATRSSPSPYYLEAIEHYVYAGDTALHVAAALYDREAAQDLLAIGADVGARNRRGAEPLHYAADGGPTLRTWDPPAQADIVTYLIARGANPNALDKSGVAPIHRAVRTRCTGAVRALLDAGADPRLKNKSGSTPMDLATQTTGRGGSGASAAKSEQERIIDILEMALKDRKPRAR